MQTLSSPKAYPPEIRKEIEAMPQTAMEIANRWMLGWPKTVKGLLATGEYLEALKYQAEQELDLFSRTDLRHLARHEICDLYDLAAAPPTPSDA